MKVIHMPCCLPEVNPYNRLLNDSLAREGVEVVEYNYVFSSYISAPISAYLRNYRPDVMHFHWVYTFFVALSRGKRRISRVKSFIFLSQVFLLRILGVRIFWTVHDLTTYEVDQDNKERVECFLRRVFSRLCDRIIVHNPSAMETVEELYGLGGRGRIRVIPHGNYIGYYGDDVSRGEARRRIGVEGSGIVFLYFGSIKPYKGVPELVEAFRRMDAPGTRLLIVGEDYTRWVVDEVKERVGDDDRIKTVFRRVRNDEVQLYMNASDVVVLPFKETLTSGSLILAASFRKPVITPAMGYVSDMLGDDGCILYDPSDSEGLLDGMIRSLEADLNAMGERNYQRVREYGWDRVGKETAREYRECVGV
ncbi:MAG: glycosyltransferase [Candidatus Altiarchaeota archaeon]